MNEPQETQSKPEAGQTLAPTACSASEQNEFETLDEAWNALIEARAEIARLRKRIGEHDGCSRWGVKDAIALKPNNTV